ncbi:hypothetical protein ACE1SV_19630 [Streptomyces sp. E-15]
MNFDGAVRGGPPTHGSRSTSRPGRSGSPFSAVHGPGQPLFGRYAEEPGKGRRRNCTGFPPYGCADDPATLPAAPRAPWGGRGHTGAVTGVSPGGRAGGVRRHGRAARAVAVSEAESHPRRLVKPGRAEPVAGSEPVAYVAV